MKDKHPLLSETASVAFHQNNPEKFSQILKYSPKQ